MKKFTFLVPFLLIASLVLASVSYSFEKPTPQHLFVQGQNYEDINFFTIMPNGYLGRVLKYYNFFTWQGKKHSGNGAGGGLGSCNTYQCY